VALTCAQRNIRYQTEMGGKNVVIVLPDADLQLAAKLTAGGAMRYAGQKCTATSRAVVVKDVEEEFLRHLRAEVAALPLGPVTDPGCAVGPLIDQATRDRLHELVAGSDARRVMGGAMPSEPGFARGNFLAPTVLAGVHPDFPPLVLMVDMRCKNPGASLTNVAEAAIEHFSRTHLLPAGENLEAAAWIELDSDWNFDEMLPRMDGASCVGVCWRQLENGQHVRTVEAFIGKFGQRGEDVWQRALIEINQQNESR